LWLQDGQEDSDKDPTQSFVEDSRRATPEIKRVMKELHSYGCERYGDCNRVIIPEGCQHLERTLTELRDIRRPRFTGGNE